MKISLPEHTTATPFRKWIWCNPEPKGLLLISAVAILIQFIWFKYLYPYPNFLPDSYSYMEAAFYNYSINLWPIGYSKFLRLFSCFTSSHWALVFFQYLVLQAAMLYLLYTIAYLFTPGKWLLRILFAVIIFNPLLLHISNFISSDALFATLSIIWLTQILWLLYKPNLTILLLHALILCAVFMVRYNALYYPVISLAVNILAPMQRRLKLTGITAIVLLVGGFIGQTIYRYYKVTGAPQFSAFGGWQQASNALYAYAHAEPDRYESVPVRFRQLHTMVTRHMDSLSHVSARPDNTLGIYYLWDGQSPLRRYMHSVQAKRSIEDGFRQFAVMGPLYADYARYLIYNHPVLFIKYYLWPNMIRYYVPDGEFLAVYNMERNQVDEMAVTWFGLKNNRIKKHITNPQIAVTQPFPFILAITNLLFMLCFISFWYLGTNRISSSYFNRVLCWVTIIWLMNLCFSVLASPVVLRYQLFPMVLAFIFLALMMESMLKQVTIPRQPYKIDFSTRDLKPSK